MTTHKDNDTHEDTCRDVAAGTMPEESTALREDVARDVFADPVRFLAGLGITARVVAETSLPAAA